MLQYARTEPEIGTGFAEVQGLRLLLDGVETGNLLSKLFKKMLLESTLNMFRGFSFDSRKGCMSKMFPLNRSILGFDLCNCMTMSWIVNIECPE